MKTEVKANWTAAVLVCRKCQKKVGKRFGSGGNRTLAKALRKELGGGKGRKAALGVVETGCLGICPKGAVTVLNGGAPGRWHLVRPGVTGAEVAEMLGVGPDGGGNLPVDALPPGPAHTELVEAPSCAMYATDTVRASTSST